MLSRRDLEKELGKGINIFPLHRDNFKENSINLTASRNAWTSGQGTVYWLGGECFSSVDTTGKKKTKTIKKGTSCVFRTEGKQDYIILFPHSTTSIETSEVLGIGNNIGGNLHSKVGLVAKGIGHIGTMLGPGYCGHLLISLHNITDDILAIKVGSTFVSLSFDYLTTQVIRTSSTISGHVDKFAELGIKLDEETRSFLTQDWKSNIAGVREKMMASDEYKKYKTHIRNNTWQEVKKYLNKRNIVAILVVVAVFIALLCAARFADQTLGVTVWEERFWTVGCSGFIGSILMGVWNFVKDKK